MTDVCLLRMASIIIISALLIVPCRLAFKIPVNLNFSGFDSFVECLNSYCGNVSIIRIVGRL